MPVELSFLLGQGPVEKGKFERVNQAKPSPDKGSSDCEASRGIKVKLRKLAILPAAVAMTFAWAGAASAASLLTLTGPIAGNHIGPQSASNPCIIAGTTCQQPAGFGYNNFQQTGNITSYNMWSTTPTAQVADGVQGTPYTVAQLTGVAGTSFTVAIDVNTASGGETLQLFEVFDKTTNTVLYNYVGPTLIGNISNNGNGYGDWTLGLISLAGLASTDQILFHAVWSGASDGAESFFIVPGNPIPEPETYAMMLVGFGLLGFVARRRKQGLGNTVSA